MDSSARIDGAAATDPAAGPGADGRYRLALGFGRWPGWRGELLLLAGILALACVLTWPLILTLGQATGTRSDYFNNLWNAWWVKHSLKPIQRALPAATTSARASIVSSIGTVASKRWHW